MKTALFRISWSVLFLVGLSQSSSSAEKVGRCPAGILDNKLCRGQVNQCHNDEDCNGESLCCSTGCNRVCMLPSFTACDHSKLFFEKQSRILSPDEAKEIQVPKCTESGKFEEIQCNDTGMCWCVDGFGFEKGGTRANSRDLVNCTSNEKCKGPQCRMLCPYGFELDNEGCEMCVCKDICKGIKCPGSLECQLQEVSCASEPCPPVPTCKKARTLESLCHVGVPFTIPESGNPFLCGTTPGKPTCPAGFSCSVNSGDDYGVCCGSEAFYEKPGLCPVISTADSNCDESTDESNCRSSCKHDFECPEMKKCCMTEGRGKQCTDALNSTLCLQQRKIAEIFSAKEIEGRGYIPQCEPNGDFVKKQCSRNGKICWCVDENGRNVPQSLSLAEFVNCTTIARRRDLVPNDDSACDISLCANTCEFGFKNDEVTGCGTCDCNEDPCSSLRCPEGSHCAYSGPKDCGGSDSCRFQPTCVPNVLHVNPCDNGTPLLDHSSNQLVVCSETGATCPSSHVCVKASVNTDGLCCLNRPRLEPTKPGMCPFISSSLCNGTLELDNKQCSSDKECEGDMKCCGLPCGAICADPLLDAQTESNKMPTVCQYLENVEMKQNEVLKNFKIAMDIPKCKKSGEFEEIQCNDKWCYCVDEFGIEIDSTRIAKQGGNLTSDFCLEKRVMPPCLDMTCRLGCDYGYQKKDNCRVCECVNPCDNNKICDGDHFCEVVDMDCAAGYCPAVPYCIPKVYAAIAMSSHLASEKKLCPKGVPYFDVEANETLSCRPRARMLQCPDDYYCYELDGTSHDAGYCCPIETDGSINVEMREGAGRFPVLSDDNILDEFSNNRKITLTDCERARERHTDMSMQDRHVNFIPRCNPRNGEWEQIQCVDEVNMCWCVNNQGKTIAGSITSGKPVCNFRQSRGKFLGSHTKVDQPVCAEGVTVHVCNKALCENKICMAHPTASCGIDPCGGCHVKFYDQNKNLLDCGAGLGKCHKEVQRIMNSGAWINQQKQSNNPLDDDDLPIEHIIEDVLQERVGRAAGLPGSFPFSTVGELLADAMKHSSVEHFGAKVSEFFLESDSSPFSSSVFPETIQIPRTSVFSNQNPLSAGSRQAFSTVMPMMMRKATCPHPSPNSILFRLTGTCVDLCNYDDECQQDERCCLVECGYRCHKVAVEFQVQLVEGAKEISNMESIMGEEEESNMLLIPPSCKSNGEFEPMQSQGDLTWCVDREGKPQPESFTRGFVVCSEEGKMIEKRSISNICPDSEKSPMICTDQCLKTKCPAHPEAICVADPCDACQVSFFSPSGEKVRCENKCLQPADPGLCRASFARYFYNSTSSRCEEFSWGGCQGNENNFETYENCRNNCEREVDACNIPVKRDGCDDTSVRWYFDAETDTCVSAIGCNTKNNGFKTKEVCESRCPLKVLCSNIIEGSLAVCNRAEACRNVTRNCGGLKSDDYICNVEPCSCIAELKNSAGEEIHCEGGEESSDIREASQIVEKVTTEGPLFRSYADDSEGISVITDQKENRENSPTTITLSGDLLVVKSEFFETKTRCLSRRDKYFSKCDNKGNFIPTQCSIDEPICWCVDSAGNQVEGTTTFLAGSSSCPTVAIDKVDVRLSFPISSPGDSGIGSQLGTEIQDLLRSIDASLVEDKVSVETVEGFLNVDFILDGESSVHISHMLEEGLKRNLLGTKVQNQFTPVDLSTSRFHYMVPETQAASQEDTTAVREDDSENSTDDNEIEPNSIMGRSDDSVTAQEVNRTDKGLNIVAICLTVAAAVTAVLITIGLFLGLQNKKVAANHPKSSKFESLPFSSPFEFDKKGSDPKSKS